MSESEFEYEFDEMFNDKNISFWKKYKQVIFGMLSGIGISIFLFVSITISKKISENVYKMNNITTIEINQ